MRGRRKRGKDAQIKVQLYLTHEREERRMNTDLFNLQMGHSGPAGGADGLMLLEEYRSD